MCASSTIVTHRACNTCLRVQLSSNVRHQRRGSRRSSRKCAFRRELNSHKKKTPHGHACDGEPNQTNPNSLMPARLKRLLSASFQPGYEHQLEEAALLSCASHPCIHVLHRVPPTLCSSKSHKTSARTDGNHRGRERTVVGFLYARTKGTEQRNRYCWNHLRKAKSLAFRIDLLHSEHTDA